MRKGWTPAVVLLCGLTTACSGLNDKCKAPAVPPEVTGLYAASLTDAQKQEALGIASDYWAGERSLGAERIAAAEKANASGELLTADGLIVGRAERWQAHPYDEYAKQQAELKRSQDMDYCYQREAYQARRLSDPMVDVARVIEGRCGKDEFMDWGTKAIDYVMDFRSCATGVKPDSRK